MTPQDFIAKWRNNELKERTASQTHFNDLCALLGVLDPIAADPTGEWFTFEKGASKTSGGEGWADVWRKGCFAWEYKGPRKDLDKAFAQLLQYQVSLENPPLLIVSDMDRIRIHTNFTNTVQVLHDFTLDDLIDGEKRDALKRAFVDPDSFKPTKTRTALTEETAQEFAGLAQRLRDRGHDPADVAHFVNQLVFCMFAEDVALLPNHMFTKMLNVCRFEWDNFTLHAGTLFRAMADKGGMVGFDRVEWFNGGLFDGAEPLPLTEADVEQLFKVAQRDWSQIDPSILGTLFERGLDPAKRSQLGAHYTDREKIMMIVKPVIIDPLEAEWADALAKMTAEATAAETKAEEALAAAKDRSELSEEVQSLTKTMSSGKQLVLFEGLELQKRVRKLDAVRSDLREADRAIKAARVIATQLRDQFVERLRQFRVLDPACGSGNFLYVSLLAIKDLEHKANLDAEALGVERRNPLVGPECVLGIELNPYAAELARVSVWIGEIQWMRRNGFDAAKNPILRTLDTIDCRDAVLAEDGTRAEWPVADVVVGNPPFITSREMIKELGGPYTTTARSKYRLQVTGSSDFVAFWFAQSINHAASHGSLVGLVATDSLPRGDSRFVLDRVVEKFKIFEAVRSMPWYNLDDKAVRQNSSTAQVRVCIVCFGNVKLNAKLDGKAVATISSDLSAAVEDGFSRRHIVRLNENLDIANQGIIPRSNVNEKERKELGLEKAAFLLSTSEAHNFCGLPSNPNGRKNGDVIKPFIVGEDILAGRGYRYLIDFTGMSEADASLFEKPFEFLRPVKAHRAAMKQPEALATWWLPWNNRTAMRQQIENDGYIATPRNSKQRVFVCIPKGFIPDCEVVAITRSDSTTLGILSSNFHQFWTLNTCSFYGVGNTPRYSHKSTFETFPFPEGLTPNIPAADYASDPRAIAIAAAAARLNELRENWLNPADLVMREPEVVPGYPDRILPRDEEAAKELKKRTLTNLYNARPAWLDNAHRTLDEAVAEAYGWGDDWRAAVLNEDEILARLFRLNQERAGV